jgi:protein SCO1/2
MRFAIADPIACRRTSAKPTAAAWRLALLAASLLLLTACAPEATQDPSGPYSGSRLDGPAPEVTLTDQDGAPFSLTHVNGRVVALTFMDSTCQDVCPLTAAEFRAVYAALPTEDQARVAFVGVNANALAASQADVLRATRQWRLDEIPSWTFLTGEPAALHAVWQAYGVEAEPVGTRVSHTAGVFLIDRWGVQRWYISVPLEDPAWDGLPLRDILLRRVRELLAEG